MKRQTTLLIDEVQAVILEALEGESLGAFLDRVTIFDHLPMDHLPLYRIRQPCQRTGRGARKNARQRKELADRR